MKSLIVLVLLSVQTLFSQNVLFSDSTLYVDFACSQSNDLYTLGYKYGNESVYDLKKLDQYGKMQKFISVSPKGNYYFNESQFELLADSSILVISSAYQLGQNDLNLDIRKYNLDLQLLQDTIVKVEGFSGLFSTADKDDKLGKIVIGFIGNATVDSIHAIFIVFDYALDHFTVINGQEFSPSHSMFIDSSHIISQQVNSFGILNMDGEAYSHRIATRQNWAYGGANSYLDLGSHFLEYTTVGYVKGIQPGFDELYAVRNSYTGVVYKFEKEAPYKLIKYNRLGDSIERPASNLNMVMSTQDNILLASVNRQVYPMNGGLFDNLRFFKLYNINSNLDLNWELIFRPTGNNIQIRLEGIEKGTNGTFYAYGEERFKFEYAPTQGFIIHIDSLGNVLPFDNLNPTKEETAFEYIWVKLYPNPTVNYLQIDIRNQTGLAYLYLYDVSGKMMINQAIYGEHNEVDVSSLAPGVYYYTLRDDKGVLKTGSLMKE